MSVNGEKTTQKDIDRLIHFWEDSLAQYRFAMGTSTQVIIQETIEALQLVKVKP